MTIVLPESLSYFVAILGLLILWEIHDRSVRAGRIQARDFWDRTGIRLFVRITPLDRDACPVCKEQSGLTYFAADSRKARAKLHAGCTNPSGCRCLLIGLYGGWPEAQRLLDRLKHERGPIPLSPESLGALLGGGWERSVSAAVDRISVHMLEALLAERMDPDAATFRYRFVTDHAGAERDLPFVVPAFLRLAELHRQAGQVAEALGVIDRFFARYPDGKAVPHAPNDAQRSSMRELRERLMAVNAAPQAG